MPENAKKPQIRFKGFTDDWEQRKVTELGKIYIGLVTTMTKHYTSKGTLLIRNSDIKDGRFEFGEEPIYLDEYFAKENLLRMHKIGDVITVHTGDVGTSAVIGEKEENSIGFATIVTRPNSQIIDSNYLSTFLNTDKHKKWAVAISTGDGRTNYNLGDYYKLTIPLPILQEQKAIATFITKINNLITLHQRKYFCSNNLIFTITTAWEQRKLNNYLIVSDEKNSENLYKKEDVLSVSGDFGIVNQIEFQGRSFAGTSVLNYGVVHKGDVVYTKSPLKATPYGIIKTNKGSTGIVSVLYGVYHTKENANADFIQVYFEQNARLNNYLRPLVNKGAKNTLLISDEEALNGEVNFAPSLNEQLKISVVFNSIDNLITLHQRKIKNVLHKNTTINLFVR